MTKEDELTVAVGHTQPVSTEHTQYATDPENTEAQLIGFESETALIPKGYFYSSYFLGSMAAIGLTLLGSVGGFALAAPILSYINDDIGPNKNITWVALMFPVGLSVGQTLLGRLSDLFGRRWFFAGGQAFGLIGAIICATANDVPTLIVGSTIVGLAAATALSYPLLIGELVPMKYRFYGTAYACICCIPFSGLAPAIANTLVARTSAGWRWCYYLMIIFDSLAFVFYFFFYFPPTFSMKYSREQKWNMIKKFDYIGTFLFMAGIVAFLFGISWGGNLYPWKSVPVITSVTVGVLTLVAFFLWEIFHPLSEPLIPMHLFANRGWIISVLLVSIGASIYYAFGVVWPGMVNLLYADGDLIYAGWLQCCVGGAFTAGQVAGPMLFTHIGYVRAQLVVTTAIGGALLGSVSAAEPDNVILPIVLLCFGNFFIGWMEALTLTLPSMYLHDQKEIGVSVGVAGSVRSGLSTIASTIYVVILTNGLNKTVPAAVGPAVIAAGLPESSVVDLLGALAIGTADAFKAVPGLTLEIQSVAVTAYKNGSTAAYSTVFLASLAFTGTGILLSLLIPDVKSRMTDQVAATLHRKQDEKALELEMQENGKLDQDA